MKECHECHGSGEICAKCEKAHEECRCEEGFTPEDCPNCDGDGWTT